MKKFMLTVLFLAGIISCKKKDPAPGCGCGSAPIKQLTEQLAVYDNSFVTILEPADGYRLSCNPEFVLGKVQDRDTVLVSGNVYAPCTDFGQGPFALIVVAPDMEVTAIHRK